MYDNLRRFILTSVTILRFPTIHLYLQRLNNYLTYQNPGNIFEIPKNEKMNDFEYMYTMYLKRDMSFCRLFPFELKMQSVKNQFSMLV